MTDIARYLEAARRLRTYDPSVLRKVLQWSGARTYQVMAQAMELLSKMYGASNKAQASVLHVVWIDRDGWYSAPLFAQEGPGLTPEEMKTAWRDTDYLGPYKRPVTALRQSLDWERDIREHQTK